MRHAKPNPLLNRVVEEGQSRAAAREYFDMNRIQRLRDLCKARLSLYCTPLIAAASLTLANAQTVQESGQPSLAEELKLVDVRNTRLHYVESGQGTSILFVHGAGGDYRTWAPLQNHISRNARYIAYSRRYHWPNDKFGAGNPYTVPEQADDLIALVQALGLAPVHVVGGSYGARVVLEAAVRRPGLFASVAVSEPAITRPPIWRPWSLWQAKQLADGLGKIGDAMKTNDTATASAHLVNAVYGDPNAWEQLPKDRKQRFLDNQTTWQALAKAPQLPPTSCDDLGKLTMPVLVLEGAGTVAGFRVTNDRLMDCLPPHAQRFVVPNAPHMWYPVNPNVSAQRILTFVQGAKR